MENTFNLKKFLAEGKLLKEEVQNLEAKIQAFKNYAEPKVEDFRDFLLFAAEGMGHHQDFTKYSDIDLIKMAIKFDEEESGNDWLEDNYGIDVLDEMISTYNDEVETSGKIER
jgi:hypothetical protein